MSVSIRGVLKALIPAILSWKFDKEMTLRLAVRKISCAVLGG